MARILIVDDHIETCRVMAMLIRHLGHEAYPLFAGSEVVPFLSENAVDLIILDIMMPGTNGMDVLRQLRGGDAPSRTPVIMMTAITDPITRREAMDLGANDYWIKASVDVAELEQRIRKHVRTDGPAGPGVARAMQALRETSVTRVPLPPEPTPSATLLDRLASLFRGPRASAR